jgi:hypothetical protein
MVVAADIGDPASSFHPIHPPWKAEVGRRAAITAWNILYGHADTPAAGPALVAVHVDAWHSSWGDYHYGMGGGVCSVSGMFCLGIRLVFDQPVVVTPTAGQFFGFPSGFELLSTSAAVQPAVLTGLADDHTVQLNVTYIMGGNPATLRYAWHDYPVMLLANTLGQPVPPFNATLPPPQ